MSKKLTKKELAELSKRYETWVDFRHLMYHIEAQDAELAALAKPECPDCGLKPNVAKGAIMHCEECFAEIKAERASLRARVAELEGLLENLWAESLRLYGYYQGHLVRHGYDVPESMKDAQSAIDKAYASLRDAAAPAARGEGK